MPAGETFTHIDAHAGTQYHTCAIASSGNAYCWGKNEVGQLGTCNLSDYLVPTRVGSGCAPAATDTPTATSTNTRTATSTRTLTRSATPAPGSNPWGTFTQIEFGDTHACAINTAQEVYCWGMLYASGGGSSSVVNNVVNRPTKISGLDGIAITKLSLQLP
jgi:alpha-tubulin suppressor-like RCC1 family protein